AALWAFGAVAQEGGLAGTWNATIETANGPFPLTFQFAVEDKTVTGSFSNRFISAIPIHDGVVKGNEVSFKITLESGMVLQYDGVLEGDELSLSTKVASGGAPGGPEEQTFTLTRAN